MGFELNSVMFYEVGIYGNLGLVISWWTVNQFCTCRPSIKDSSLLFGIGIYVLLKS